MEMEQPLSHTAETKCPSIHLMCDACKQRSGHSPVPSPFRRSSTCIGNTTEELGTLALVDNSESVMAGAPEWMDDNKMTPEQIRGHLRSHPHLMHKQRPGHRVACNRPQYVTGRLPTPPKWCLHSQMFVMPETRYAPPINMPTNP
jgi:hypothetical protein